MPYVRAPGGICPLCSRRVDVLEGHHVSYDPEKKIYICHDCHFKIHHLPHMLSVQAVRLLNSFA